MDKLYDTPVKAIRKKCLDCSCGQPKEIRLCPIIKCPLYPYRMGRRPSQTTLDTMNEFYSENTEPAQGFTPKKSIGDKIIHYSNAVQIPETPMACIKK